MKNKLPTILTIAALGSILLISGCDSGIKRTNAEIFESKELLGKAEAAYFEELRNYKELSDATIGAHNKVITEFKERLREEKKDEADYKIQLDSLKSRNMEIRLKTDLFNASRKVKWEAFKAEYTSDLHDLSNAYKDFNSKNSQ